MDKNLMIVITVFIGIMVGIPLLLAIADVVIIETDDIDIINESLDISTGFNDTDFDTSAFFNLTNSDWTTNSVIMYNGSGYINTSAYNVDYTREQVNFTNASWVWTINTNGAENNTGVNYSYYHADYITGSTNRTLLGLIPLFFVIGILMLVIAKIMGFDWIGKLGKKK